MTKSVGLEIRVKGTVQGVGFRPTTWRLAHENKLCGDVRNDAEGVLIRIRGLQHDLDTFLYRLQHEAPPLAHIESIESSVLTAELNTQEFRIVGSQSGKNNVRVSADAATCADCIAEFTDSDERRYFYPFTNCTHCGPRLSIVRGIPYDRATTTMSAFQMCASCALEYRNPEDRRFHAQPIACHLCGPRVWLEDNTGNTLVGQSDGGTSNLTSSSKESLAVIRATVAALKQGKIIAVRGLGGFHLAVDARNPLAVETLRRRKRRYAKPFALMADQMATVRQYCVIHPHEELALKSVEAPIVLLQKRNDAEALTLPEQISPGSGLLGFMLAYSPLHILLCREFGGPLVMTSGNVSDEPQITALASARQGLGAIADVLLMHNRDIANRIDDSVMRLMAGEMRLLRRARGFAPRALRLPQGFEHAGQMLALGGELKSTFCLLKDGTAIVSQHQGDLEDPATFDDFEKNLALYQAQYDHHPEYLAADKHPEYLSAKFAVTLSEASGLPLNFIQHHHAHIASCMAENGLPLRYDKVLGIALDGLGLGDDGQIWGGEFLLADYCTSQRLASFEPVAMIGGAMAIKEPWRNTYAYIHSCLGWDEYVKNFAGTELHQFLSGQAIAAMQKMLRGGVNVPAASSCGRLFDAVAAALNLSRERAHFEGEGAIALEMLVDFNLMPVLLSKQYDSYAFGWYADSRDPGLLRLSAATMWRALLDDLKQGVTPPIIAARFHAGLALALVSTVDKLAQNHVFSSVALSGGCLQNRVLAESLHQLLQERGYRVLLQQKVPANDGGLSLGQAVIAAAQRLHSNQTLRP